MFLCVLTGGGGRGRSEPQDPAGGGGTGPSSGETVHRAPETRGGRESGGREREVRTHTHMHLGALELLFN